MKVLLVGDASRFHYTLAGAMRRLGHSVDLFCPERPFNGKAGGAAMWAWLHTMGRNRWRGYDVVQMAGPTPITLRPQRLAAWLRRLRRGNGKVVLSVMGYDRAYIDMCLAADTPMPYSEFSLAAMKPIVDGWHAQPLGAYLDELYATVDGITTILYEYQLAEPFYGGRVPMRYCGLPIDLDRYQPIDLAARRGKINLFLGRHSWRTDEKGTVILEEMARDVVAQRPDAFTLTIAEDLPFDEYSCRQAEADIVLDQLYSPTPALNALQAMARGQVAVSGGEEAFYNYIGEAELRPIVNVQPHAIAQCAQRLLQFADNREALSVLGRDSRRFVERHHRDTEVAQRYIDFFKSL